MSPQEQADIAEALSKHQAALAKLADRFPKPLMTTVSDKDGYHLDGNRTAYIYFAIACLQAAQGHSVPLWTDAFWLEDGSWSFSGLQVSPNPTNWGWRKRRVPPAAL